MNSTSIGFTSPSDAECDSHSRPTFQPESASLRHRAPDEQLVACARHPPRLLPTQSESIAPSIAQDETPALTATAPRAPLDRRA